MYKYKLTNVKTQEKINTNNATLIAKKIGVSRSTIGRWRKKGEVQIYNVFILEFNN